MPLDALEAGRALVRFTPLDFAGVWLIEQERRTDHRGFFARAWGADELRAEGLSTAIEQVNIGFSVKKGTVRGMHLQTAPHSEVKVIRCTRGAAYDVVVDLRPSSPTFCRWLGIEIDAAGGRAVYAPEGFAHGYQALEPDTEIMYFTSKSYVPASAVGVRYDDPCFAIDWPLPVASISDADLKWPDFDAAQPFPFDGEFA
jgi:dTDP-4-dehydrorhamnose 3,5-epimerase